MPATTMNLVGDDRIEQGADYEYPIEVVDANNVELDLSDMDIRAYVRQEYDSPTVMAQFTIEEVDLANGRFNMVMSNGTTSGLLWGDAVWDLELEYDTGEVIRLAQGKVYIDPNVTR